MSYEGYEEFICPNGHHWGVDASVFNYGNLEEREQAYVCPHCKEKAKYACSVDETNGYNENNPWTFSGPKEEIGFDDEWHQDHYGNKYAVKIPKFQPNLFIKNRWSEIKNTED